MKDEIIVSICCITYNHEKYIREALDSFLMQKTNFKYEVIIHDDASTDNTANIIREYEKKYPDIIKPIYQTENQYSKGKEITTITFERAKGKYIALCEGDDYWCDENKLQTQVDYFELHPDCTFCFHNAKVYSEKNKKFNRWNLSNNRFKKKNGKYNSGELNLLGFIPTASFMFKSIHAKNLPSWFQNVIVGDIPIKLLMTSYGYANYIDKIMSVYRVETGKSVTDVAKNETFDIEKATMRNDRTEWIIDKFNEFSNYKYENQIKISKNDFEKNRLMMRGEYKKVINNKNYRIFLDRVTIIKLLIKVYLPYIHKILKAIKEKIKKED